MLHVQVDIFSLGVVMYELLMMTPLACMVSMSGGRQLAYAQCVALGHREALQRGWPSSVQVRMNALQDALLLPWFKFQTT